MQNSPNNTEPAKGFRGKIHEIIFGSETLAGKLFDLFLIAFIFVSGIVVMLDSVKSVKAVWGAELFWLDWFFTIVFTFEYLFRIYALNKPTAYIFSIYGLIDFFAIFPSYLSLLFPGTHYFSIIRIFRTLRIFRILKLAQHLEEADLLVTALRASRKRISVFVFAILLLVTMIGSLMYIIEGDASGFTSIPISIYWAVVTLTTVGYGDISPRTPLGQAFSVMIMLLGYAIIAIPTGIVTSEIISSNKKLENKACPACGSDGHDGDARFCKFCGARI